MVRHVITLRINIVPLLFVWALFPLLVGLNVVPPWQVPVVSLLLYEFENFFTL